VHLRVSCPPTRYPCYYGIDFPDPSKLIASGRTVEEIQAKLEVDSLGYLSLDGMLSCVSPPAENCCTACWSAKYAVPPVDEMTKEMHEQPSTQNPLPRTQKAEPARNPKSEI
jgi:amidophosphoribosyltransferase